MCVEGGERENERVKGSERDREQEDRERGTWGRAGEGGWREGDKSHLEDTKKWGNDKNTDG